MALTEYINHPVAQFAKSLSPELLAAAYEGASCDGLEGRADFNTLVSGRWVVVDDGRMRMPQRVKDIFDRATSRQRLAIYNPDVGNSLSEADSAMLDMLAYQDAGDDVAADFSRQDMKDSLLRAYEDLADATEAIFRRVQQNYGRHPNPERRRARHADYETRLDTIRKALRELTAEIQDVRFNIDDDMDSFLTALNVKMIPLNDRLTQVHKIMRDYMYRQRELERRASKIWAVINHAGRNPGFAMTVVEDRLEKCDFFRRAAEISIAAYPDVADGAVAEKWSDLAARLSARLKARTIVKKKRPDSGLLTPNDDAELAKPYRFVLPMRHLCNAAFTGGVCCSAAGLYPELAEKYPDTFEGISVNQWLYAVNNFMNKDIEVAVEVKTSMFVRHELIGRPSFPLSGVEVLADVIVYPTSMPVDRVEQFKANQASGVLLGE
jgi:hypothetical protein